MKHLRKSCEIIQHILTKSFGKLFLIWNSWLNAWSSCNHNTVDEAHFQTFLTLIKNSTSSIPFQKESQINNFFPINLSMIFIFNVVFFLRIATLTWLKSTLLLKNKCFGTTIYMKTQFLQTNETQHYGKGKCLRSKRWSRERVALIKSLIYARWKETRLRRGCQIELKMSADIYYKV